MSRGRYDNYYVQFCAPVVQDSVKAVLLDLGDEEGEQWIPRTQLIEGDREDEVWLSTWICEQKDIDTEGRARRQESDLHRAEPIMGYKEMDRDELERNPLDFSEEPEIARNFDRHPYDESYKK